MSKGRNICASSGSQPILAISPDKKILTIRGAVFDTVTQLNSSVLFGEGVFELDSDSNRRMARWNLRCKACFESYIAFAEAGYKFPEGHTREESLWRTLCCNLTSEIPINRAPKEYGAGYKILRAIFETTKADGLIDTEALLTRIDVADYSHYMALVCTIGRFFRGKNLCVTAGGYLGNVPHGTLVGDKICIVFGSTVPFLLRECSEGYFKLVGECYIHGVMDGEAMKERDMGALSRDFEIV